MADSQKLSVALIQMVSLVSQDGRTEKNWSRAEALVSQAASEGAELIVLPENFLTFGSKKRFTIQEQGEWVSRLAALAKTNSTWLVAGTLPLSLSNTLGEELELNGEAKPFAACLVFDAEGVVRGEYRKVHLFDANVNDDTARYRESDDYSAGKVPVAVQSPWGKLGLAVCYDLRFPEYFRELRELQADFVAIPSAFTFNTGKAHWQVLCRARAIENQFFVFACNQGGAHSATRKTWGESMVVDPWGSVVASHRNGEAIVSAVIDLAQIAEIRENMPVWQHRKI